MIIIVLKRVEILFGKKILQKNSKYIYGTAYRR
jgi:hypothetical protein